VLALPRIAILRLNMFAGEIGNPVQADLRTRFDLSKQRLEFDPEAVESIQGFHPSLANCGLSHLFHKSFVPLIQTLSRLPDSARCSTAHLQLFPVMPK
jgi:hypothetical protein